MPLWVEQLPNWRKYKYFRRCKGCLYREMETELPITLTVAQIEQERGSTLVMIKIARKIESSSTTNVSFHDAFSE